MFFRALIKTTSVFNSSILNKNILARISLKTPAFHILNETGMHLVTEPRKYLGPVNISSFNVQILDEFGRVLNINNMDYSFCLNFEITLVRLNLASKSPSPNCILIFFEES